MSWRRRVAVLVLQAVGDAGYRALDHHAHADSRSGAGEPCGSSVGRMTETGNYSLKCASLFGEGQSSIRPTSREKTHAVLKFSAVVAALGLFLRHRPARPAAPAPAALVREGVTEKLTEHVWAIPDGSASLVPNVGIIAGAAACWWSGYGSAWARATRRRC